MNIRRAARVALLVLTACGLYGLVWAGDTKQPEKDESAPERPQLQWLDYGEALEKAAAEDKHVVVDFYTSWCGWCKVMDRKTYGDERVIRMLNDNFVIAKINAESAKRFAVGDSEKSGRQLAREFRVQSFPMTWFLKPDGNRLVNVPGFIRPEQFILYLEYIHDRAYVKSSE